MKGFERLDDHEIERRYKLAAELVKGWADAENPDIQLAPLGQRDLGEEDLTVEVINIRGGLKKFGEKNDAIKRLIPGADLDTEDLPTKTRYRINIPLWIPVSASHAFRGSKSRGVVVQDSGKPSEVWLMFLFMVQSVLGTVLYFRLQ